MTPAMVVSRTRWREEAGFTLVEVLVAATCMVIVLLAAFDLYAGAARSQQATERRTTAMTTGEQGLERLTRQVRAATDARLAPDSRALDVTVLERPAGSSAAASARRVLLDCGQPALPPARGFSCRRFAFDAGIRGAQLDVVVNGLRDAGVFRLEPVLDPRFVHFRLHLAVAGARRPAVLHDSVSLRNRGDQG